jgi:predicted DNA-binding transcriptional regulator YafY
LAESQQLERVLEIDHQIRAGMYPNADSISAKFETGRRVVFKDREFLLRLGAPLAYSHERKGWYYTDPSFALPSTFVTEGELLAFFLSVEIARRHFGTQLELALHSAAEKIARTLKGRVRIELDSLSKYCFFEETPTSLVNEDELMRLYKAMEQSRRVKISYLSASKGELTERTVDPYHLFNREGDWYLVGFDRLREEIRTFHLDRIQTLEVLPTSFKIPSDFNVEDWIRTGFNAVQGKSVDEIVILFDAYQARWIRERQIHQTQILEERPDGALLLTFQTSGIEAVKRWVMQYGSHAEVLKPAALRDELNEEVKKVLMKYEKHP